MPRHRPLGPRDDVSVEDGDDVFMGFRSRVQPAALPPGVARFLGNARCERGTFRPRKGTCACSTDLVLTNPPVVLDFVLPTSKAITSITRVGTTATVTTTAAHGWSTGTVAAIEGATGADGLLYNGDFIITVTSATTFTYLMAGTPTGSAAGTLSAASGLRIYESYDDLVRGSCAYATPSNVEGIVIATTYTAYVYRPGEALAPIAYPADETVAATDVCDLVQFIGSVYLFRGYQTAEAFTLASLTRSGTTATATKTAHGLAVGQWVDVQGAAQADYKGLFRLTAVPTADTFEFTVDGAAVTPATGTITARPCKAPLVWDANLANDFVAVPAGPHASGGTLIRMPAAGWGLDFSRRLVLPLSRSEIILSDFGDAATYDTQYSQLRILPGSADWLMGVAPYQELRLIVLYRKSIHEVELATTNAAPVAIHEITRGFGCVARRSVANCGNVMLWLSDQGVTGLQIQNQLQLIPFNLPLSDAIGDQIETINWAYASGAVAIFWNNRYYLAVPTGTSTRNSTVFVFNFLNRTEGSPLGEWESVDAFPGEFDIQSFHVIDYEGQKRLHAVSSFGFVFVLEELEEDEWGTSASDIGSYPITGRLWLRDFTLGTRESKRFGRLRLNSNLETGDAFTVDFVARNPDRRATVHTYAATSDTDVTAAVRVPGLRGAAGTVELTTTAGRPEIRSLAVEATTSASADTLRT